MARTLCGNPNCKQCYPNGALIEDEAEVQVTRRVTPLPPPRSSSGGGGGGGSGGGSTDDGATVWIVIGVIVFVLVCIGKLVK